jgi:hypothetical protein
MPGPAVEQRTRSKMRRTKESTDELTSRHCGGDGDDGSRERGGHLRAEELVESKSIWLRGNGEVAGKRRWAARGRRMSVFARIALFAFAWVAHGFAAGGRADYDLDNDGLIEINDLDDLNDIRNDGSGHSLYGSSAGCPTSGCNGFELTTDLDFDTNGGGVGPGDEHFTDSGGFQGFVPIELLSFVVFDGGGHTIRNLTNIGAIDTFPQGLFQLISASHIKDLHFEDPYFDGFNSFTGVLAGQITESQVDNVSVTGGSMFTNGSSEVGGLVGGCVWTQLEEIRTSFHVRSSGSVGGVLGAAENCHIWRSFSLGRTTSDRYHRSIGGLIGHMIDGSITDSFVSGSVGSGHYFGGLVGDTEGTPNFTNTFVSGAVVGDGTPGGAMIGFGPATFVSSFFATDTTGFTKTKTAGSGATAVTLADLKCTDAPSDPDCLAGLFAGWQSRLNSDGQPAWDFGNSQQVPALRIKGVVYRDSDGDGILDQEDEFPNHWAASLDSDNDGAIDFWREGCEEQCRAASGLVLDQFPSNAAAALDLDLDNRPDAWNATCNAACQTSSGLTLDARPGDFDNDGVGDVTDQDDDGNGMPDVDLDSDNLIDIHTFAELALIHNDPTGVSLRTSFLQDYGDIENNSGCRPRVIPMLVIYPGILVHGGGVLARHCEGYELMNDLDFDTNGNGVIDEAEKIWNDQNPEPRGWDSLGHDGDDPRGQFQAIFEGNGHVIRNLWIEQDPSAEDGLFGGVRGGTIRNLGLAGELAMIGGPVRLGSSFFSGALVANLMSSTVSNCYSTIPVHAVGGDSAGGLVGQASTGTIVGSFSTGDILAEDAGCDPVSCDATGGLVGSVIFDSTVEATFASGVVFADEGHVGGLVGEMLTGSVVSGSFSTALVGGSPNEFADLGGLIGAADGNAVTSYWATDSSSQSTSAGNAQGATNAELQCPVGADNTTCRAGVTLFDDWEDYSDQEGLPYWDIGTSTELPGLCLDGDLYRVNPVGELQPVEPCFCSETQAELVTNQGFETNTSGWTAMFGATIATSTTQEHGGARSLRISNRTQGTWQGASYNLLGQAVPGETLTANLWARVEGDPSEPVYFTQRSVCQGASTVYTRIAEATATNTGWVQLNGTVAVPNCTLTELVVYAEGPRTNVVLYIDDVSVTHEVLECGGTEGPLGGSYIVTTDWGAGYCVELQLTNPNAAPTTNWSATFNTNGATIYDDWNVNRSASTGSVTMTPSEAWAQVIPAGGTSYSLGFCATRPTGSTAMPSTPVVTGVF